MSVMASRVAFCLNVAAALEACNVLSRMPQCLEYDPQDPLRWKKSWPGKILVSGRNNFTSKDSDCLLDMQNLNAYGLSSLWLEPGLHRNVSSLTPSLTCNMVTFLALFLCSLHICMSSCYLIVDVLLDSGHLHT
jgi:hypothetical protein